MITESLEASLSIARSPPRIRVSFLSIPLYFYCHPRSNMFYLSFFLTLNAHLLFPFALVRFLIHSTSYSNEFARKMTKSEFSIQEP